MNKGERKKSFFNYKIFFDFEKNSYIDTESLEILDEYQIQAACTYDFLRECRRLLVIT